MNVSGSVGSPVDDWLDCLSDLVGLARLWRQVPDGAVEALALLASAMVNDSAIMAAAMVREAREVSA